MKSCWNHSLWFQISYTILEVLEPSIAQKVRVPCAFVYSVTDLYKIFIIYLAKLSPHFYTSCIAMAYLICQSLLNILNQISTPQTNTITTANVNTLIFFCIIALILPSSTIIPKLLTWFIWNLEYPLLKTCRWCWEKINNLGFVQTMRLFAETVTYIIRIQCLIGCHDQFLTLGSSYWCLTVFTIKPQSFIC